MFNEYPRYSYEIQDTWHSIDASLNEISPQISNEASSKNFTELRVFNEYPRYSYEIQDKWHSIDASLNEISPQISDEASSKNFTEL